jgi:hypothetical protein
MKRYLVVLLTVVTASVLLTACENLPTWKLADQGETCIQGFVIEKHWNGGLTSEWNQSSDFKLLVQKNTGELGIIIPDAYQYVKLKPNDPICIIP